jgi:hypothetical protein
MKFEGSVPKVPAPINLPPPSEFDNGHWQFTEQMGLKPYVGFLYIVYDKLLNRAYLGKKLFLGTGKLNIGKDTGWRKYKSSSGVLKDVWTYRNLDEFEFICIEQYKTKGTLSYAETWSLCFVEAPTTREFYNTRIEKVSWVCKEPISDRNKQALLTLLNRMQAKGI